MKFFESLFSNLKSVFLAIFIAILILSAYLSSVMNIIGLLNITANDIDELQCEMTIFAPLTNSAAESVMIFLPSNIFFS